ncbi:hypothetical protein [Streptomyces sp. NPDC002156]
MRWIVGQPDEGVQGLFRVVKGAYGGAPRWAMPTLDNPSRLEDRQLSGDSRGAAPVLCT